MQPKHTHTHIQYEAQYLTYAGLRLPEYINSVLLSHFALHCPKVSCQVSLNLITISLEANKSCLQAYILCVGVQCHFTPEDSAVCVCVCVCVYMTQSQERLR